MRCEGEVKGRRAKSRKLNYYDMNVNEASSSSLLLLHTGPPHVSSGSEPPRSPLELPSSPPPPAPSS